RWPLLIAWQVAEAVVWVTRMLWLLARDQTQAGQDVRGVDYHWFAGSLLIRDALVIALMVLIIREILRPTLDVVRRFDVDDPSGGVFDRAPDRFPPWLRWMTRLRRTSESERPAAPAASLEP